MDSSPRDAASLSEAERAKKAEEEAMAAYYSRDPEALRALIRNGSRYLTNPTKGLQ
jgi:hypothetical protein